MPQINNWFIRRKDGPIKGPFPSGQIEQYLLLGRFVISDEVSMNKVEWKKISSIPHLIPEILISAKYDETAQQKLASKKRWADERRGLEAEKPDKERRNVGNKEFNRFDKTEYTEKNKKLFTAYSQIFLVIIFVSVIAFVSFQYMPDNIVSVANCGSKPQAKVNWTHCQKVGVQLKELNMTGAMLNSASIIGAVITNVNFSNANFSYTEMSLSKLTNIKFSNATLIGTIIQNSDLVSVDFSNSNLQYINFTGSRLRDINFSGANLSNAIWIDGRKCAKNSIGKCK
ncbi:hypothetical protein MNBD_GAMMA22-575 [hydrothermal vent metagenome]|uniref:Pentapeptide repeat family protein n=1 Tax=hydrothermal vent metagenome TaxID=652676 RepID=A0A3B1AK16_9ZZZZ